MSKHTLWHSYLLLFHKSNNRYWVITLDKMSLLVQDIAPCLLFHQCSSIRVDTGCPAERWNRARKIYLAVLDNFSLGLSRQYKTILRDMELLQSIDSEIIQQTYEHRSFITISLNWSRWAVSPRNCMALQFVCRTTCIVTNQNKPITRTCEYVNNDDLLGPDMLVY